MIETDNQDIEKIPGGCLDSLVRVLSFGLLGIETIKIYPQQLQISDKNPQLAMYHTDSVIWEHYLGDGPLIRGAFGLAEPRIERRIIRLK